MGARGAEALAAGLAVAGGAVRLHAWLVHFPLGLIATAALVDLAVLAAGPHGALRRVATGLYAAGAATLLAAYVTGRDDAAVVRVPGPAHALVGAHWTWALWATSYLGTVSAARLALDLSGWLAVRRRWLPVAAACAAGLLLLLPAAERGGRLVYEYGVGVAAPRVRQPAQPTLPESAPSCGADS